MKLAIAVLVLGIAPAFGAELPADLAKALEDYNRAQFDNDIPELERLLSDDYLLVNSDTSLDDKQKVLADHRMPGFKIDPYVLEQPVTQVWDDAAVIGGLGRLSWTQDGERHTRVIRIAYVWAKRDGKWQTVYTQVTRVPR